MSVMATRYSTAQPLASPTYNQYYNGGVQYNPHPNPPPQPSQPVTTYSSPSSSVSPPSSHSARFAPHVAHQLRQPRTPLYIPAVLRPTEKPVRNSPPKDSARGSFESTDAGRQPLERLGTAGSIEPGINRVITEEWSDEALGEVTGPPTRDHWKPDPSSPKCTTPTCGTTFSLLARRHHCRRCGNLFCHSHSSAAVPLDQHARFHPLGTVQRVCDACHADYAQWLVMRSSRTSSAGSISASGSGGSGSSSSGNNNNNNNNNGNAGVAVPVLGKPQGIGFGQKVGSLAQSVPRDWSWSTF